MRQQSEMLEHHADLVAPQLDQLMGETTSLYKT
jgi:hypothetical protein